MVANAVQLLGLLAAAAFAGSSSARSGALVALAASFVAGLVALPAPAAIWLPVFVALAAMLALARPQWSLVAPIAAGVSAAGWVSVAGTAGLPWVAGIVVGAGVVATGVSLARTPRFAPPVLRDEALLLVGAVAVVLAVAGDLATGWRSAAAFAATPLASDAPEGGLGLVAVAVAAVVLGGGYGWWTRR